MSYIRRNLPRYRHPNDHYKCSKCHTKQCQPAMEYCYDCYVTLSNPERTCTSCAAHFLVNVDDRFQMFWFKCHPCVKKERVEALRKRREIYEAAEKKRRDELVAQEKKYQEEELEIARQRQVEWEYEINQEIARVAEAKKKLLHDLQTDPVSFVDMIYDMTQQLKNLQEKVTALTVGDVDSDDGSD